MDRNLEIEPQCMCCHCFLPQNGHHQPMSKQPHLRVLYKREVKRFCCADGAHVRAKAAAGVNLLAAPPTVIST